MGITIHYEFKFKGTPEQALEKLKKVRNTALDLPFEKVKEIWELDYSKGFNDDIENKRAASDDAGSYRWAKIQYEQRGKWKNNALISDPNAELYKGWVFTAWSGAGCSIQAACNLAVRASISCSRNSDSIFSRTVGTPIRTLASKPSSSRRPGKCRGT